MEGTALVSYGPALAALLAGLNIVNLIYTWWRTRDQNVENRFRTGSERMDRLDNRLVSVEQTLRGTATKENMHEVQLGLTAVGGELREIRAMQSASIEHGRRQDQVLTRLEQYLLDRGGK